MNTQRRCEYCGRTADGPWRPNKRFCTAKCSKSFYNDQVKERRRRKATKRRRACANPECGVIFESRNSRQVYCTPKCRNRTNHVIELAKNGYPETPWQILLAAKVLAQPWRPNV